MQRRAPGSTKASAIYDDWIYDLFRALNHKTHEGMLNGYTNEILAAFPDFPEKVVLAKLRQMYNKARLGTECACGCSGPWYCRPDAKADPKVVPVPPEPRVFPPRVPPDPATDWTRLATGSVLQIQNGAGEYVPLGSISELQVSKADRDYMEEQARVTRALYGHFGTRASDILKAGNRGAVSVGGPLREVPDDPSDVLEGEETTRKQYITTPCEISFVVAPSLAIVKGQKIPADIMGAKGIAEVLDVKEVDNGLEITARLVGEDDPPANPLREVLERARERLKETLDREVRARNIRYGMSARPYPPTVDTGDGPIIDIEAQPNDE